MLLLVKYDFEKINILEYAFGEGGGGRQKAYAEYAFINVDNCERPLTQQRLNPAHAKHYHRQVHTKLEPPSPPGASAWHWHPPHNQAQRLPRTTMNDLSADVHINRLSSCRIHSPRSPTSNWWFRAPSPRTARAWRSATVGAAPSMRWYSRMRALLYSARVSANRNHLVATSRSPTDQTLAQQRHQGPEVPANLIRVTQHFLLRTSTKVN